MLLLLSPPTGTAHFLSSPTWCIFLNQTLTLGLLTIRVFFFRDRVFHGILEHFVIANIPISQMFILCC